jgi:drug/metabolite transporter (DMT)-like permease
MHYSQAQIRRAIALSFLMIFMASTAVAATKFASARANTAAIITVQYLVCTLLCLPRVLRPGLSSLRTSRGGLHLVRGIVGVLNFYLFYLALEHIPLVDAMVLRQSAPLTVPLVVWLWMRERISGLTWLPLVIGFVGIVVILRPSPDGISLWHVAAYLSAVLLAVSMVATNRLGTTEPTARILFYYCVFSLACVAPFSAGGFDRTTAMDWVAMLYVGVAIYGTLELYTRAYGMAPTTVIAPINYFAVVLGAFWGWLFWDQVPDAVSILGSAMVIGGGLLTIFIANRPALSPNEDG